MLRGSSSQRPFTRHHSTACNLNTSHQTRRPTSSCGRDSARHYDVHRVASKRNYASDASSALAGTVLAVGVAVANLLQPNVAYALPQERLEGIRQQIEKDFSQGQYYVTGKLTPSLYDENCQFKDPTTDVKGVKPYTTAVASLFDPSVSKADLLSSSVSGPNSITLKWRLEGKLKIGNLNIKPYTGTTVYTVDEESGLITKHTETWDISAVDALLSTVIPGFGAPPAPPV